VRSIGCGWEDWIDVKIRQESWASGRVLLAEDDPTVRLVLTRVLRGAGYQVVVVSHGAEALDMLEGRSAYDLVVTDSRMPHLSGPELVRILRGARRSAIPVVVLSGAPPDPGQIKEWQRLGGVSWMLKPFGCRALLGVLAEALGEPTPEAKSWRR
jgi:two-component system cell cycle sensor histidine kinase/response regulator CckA